MKTLSEMKKIAAKMEDEDLLELFGACRTTNYYEQTPEEISESFVVKNEILRRMRR